MSEQRVPAESLRQLPLAIPYGAIMEVVKFFPRRRVLVEYGGREVLTMGYYLRKEEL